VQQCNTFNHLSPLTPSARDLDLLTKDGVALNVSATISSHDVVVDEFSSFMFWRQQLPSVDVDDLSAILASQGHVTSDDSDDTDDGLAMDYDEFNYWRVPIPQLDITDLLRCLHQL